MLDLNDLLADFQSAREKSAVLPTAFLLVVNITDQTVSLLKNPAVSARPAVAAYQFLKVFACSTSRFGVGQVKNSQCTPLGLHCIAEKIGGGQPAVTVFKARQIIGHTSQPEFADAKITTRILWLEGLEPGYNRGGAVDSHERYIYIHGTADQSSLGRPATHGCVHVADKDLIPLFELLPSGTLVWIGQG